MTVSGMKITDSVKDYFFECNNRPEGFRYNKQNLFPVSSKDSFGFEDIYTGMSDFFQGGRGYRHNVQRRLKVLLINLFCMW